jgi:hypothetical protein
MNQNVAGEMEELDFLTLFNFNLNITGHMWLVFTILHSLGLE